jgi:hypothetical protein
MYEPCVCVEILCLTITYCFKMFVGIILEKPSRDFTYPQGSPRGLKGLLQMLNAIVSPMTTGLCFVL